VVSFNGDPLSKRGYQLQKSTLKGTDLFGNPTLLKEISVNVYHDEREIPNKWLYHSFLFIPVNAIDEVSGLLIGKRGESGWHREIHFVDLRDTQTANKLALGWLNLFGGQLHQKLYFYLLGVNYHNLEKKVWANRTTRNFKIYNRFFQIGLYGAIKWFFLNPRSGFGKVTIDKLFSDSKSRTTQDKFHTQPIEEVEAKALYKGENIVFSCNRIVEIDSDHEKESNYSVASHLIQFVDIVSGSFSQLFDATSSHEGKCECGKKLLSCGLPNDLMGYDSKQFQSPYYKRYAVSFFPKAKLSETEIMSGECAKNLFYYSRALASANENQGELVLQTIRRDILKK
jgi:hypothetical protein